MDAVFCNPDRPSGRGRKLEAPPVKLAALELGLPLHQPERWKDAGTRALWEALRIDLAIVVAYGHILPAWMLDSLSLGAWNLHSLLPRWRGAAPVNHAILAGDAETGVSLMRLTPGLDEGPVLALARRPITMEDDAEGLLKVLAGDAATLLSAQLPAIRMGMAKPVAQREGQATSASKLSKDMAKLHPERSALELHRQVRALQPWPGSWVETVGGRLAIWRAEAIPGWGGGEDASPGRFGRFGLYARDGYRALREVQPAGGRRMTFDELVRGRPGIIGSSVEGDGG